MDKIGWKWWKHKVFDKAQARLELVDIWHFILSWMLQENDQMQFIDMTDCEDWHSDSNLLHTSEAMASAALDMDLNRAVYWFYRGISHESIKLSFEELYRLYIGKNTLNFFRQDHGYADGTYRKIWSDGREDNDHLADIINARKDSDDFAADVYQDLLNEYYDGLPAPIDEFNPAILYS